jgi:hypothetical protein
MEESCSAIKPIKKIMTERVISKPDPTVTPLPIIIKYAPHPIPKIRNKSETGKNIFMGLNRTIILNISFTVSKAVL